MTFVFWPESHPEQRIEIAGVSDGNGQYTADYFLKNEGIYVVRCHVSSDTLEAMPAKRFAIGQEAVLLLAALEQQQTTDATFDNGSGGGQHLH